MPREIAQALHASRLADLRARLASLLPAAKPVTLEIGSGHGHFLTGYAAAHPERLCLGIDIIGDRLDRAARKSGRARLANIHWLHAEARLFLEAFPSGSLIDETFLLFSDPWPKRRHWKNRVLQPAFLGELAARTRPGGRLYFRTDHADYFAQGLDFARTHSGWEVDASAAWPFELPTVFQQRAESHQSFIARRV